MASKKVLKLLDKMEKDLRNKYNDGTLFDYMYENSEHFRKDWDKFVEDSKKSKDIKKD